MKQKHNCSMHRHLTDLTDNQPSLLSRVIKQFVYVPSARCYAFWKNHHKIVFKHSYFLNDYTVLAQNAHNYKLNHYIPTFVENLNSICYVRDLETWLIFCQDIALESSMHFLWKNLKYSYFLNGWTDFAQKVVIIISNYYYYYDCTNFKC